MKVWIVFRESYAGDDVLGVYASKEAATAAHPGIYTTEHEVLGETEPPDTWTIVASDDPRGLTNR